MRLSWITESVEPKSLQRKNSSKLIKGEEIKMEDSGLSKKWNELMSSLSIDDRLI